MAFTKPVVYHSEKVNIILDGYYVNNIAKEGVTITKNEDNVKPVVGLHGDYAYATNVDRSGECTFTVQMNSDSYLRMRKLAVANREFQFSVVDANEQGKTIISNQWCIFKKTPDFKRSDEIDNVEFTVLIPYLDYVENV